MLTLPQIYQRVNYRRKESAKYVNILQMKKGWDSLGRGYVASASYSHKVWDPYKQKYVKNKRGPGGKPTRYVTVIVFLDPRLHVSVSCSCPDFRYRWEVALNRKQAAEIEYSNGELPVIRNPSMKTAHCKHLVALYEKIRPHLPARRAHDDSPAIAPPQVGVAPSELRKAEQQRKAKKQNVVAPVKITVPRNVQRSTKPGKKQSTAPRPQAKASVKTPALKVPRPTPMAPLAQRIARRRKK